MVIFVFYIFGRRHFRVCLTFKDDVPPMNTGNIRHTFNIAKIVEETVIVIEINVVELEDCVVGPRWRRLVLALGLRSVVHGGVGV